MNASFVEQVAEMRKAQKEYDALVMSVEARFKQHEISGLRRRCLRLESQVDKALIDFKDQTRQLLLIDLTKRTDEERGAYNVEHGSEETQNRGT
jgi:hypothetical protein